MTETAKFTSPIICSHCGNKAPMEIVGTYQRDKTQRDWETDPEWEAGTNWEMLLCPNCSNILLRRIDWHEFYEPNEWPTEILYPSSDALPAGLPHEVAQAYQNALKVKRVDSNAFAVLLGRVLDKVCLDRGASGGSLSERLTSLATKGEIPIRLAEMAHQLRHLRNIGAHADLGNLTPAEVPILDDLCKAILEYLYTAPQLIEQVDKRLQKLKWV